MRTVLIVDDDKLNRMLLSRILEDSYAVLEAANGVEALEVLDNNAYGISAVLLDIVMPKMDGFEVLKQIRSDARFVALPVIVTTGSVEVDQEVKALNYGATDFIIKPYNPPIILQRLHNTIKLCETAAIINSSQRDDLTGLYNRKSFFEIASIMINAKEENYYIISAIDIDNFKVINDQYGMKKGDEILRYIGQRMQPIINELGGICCRVTADKFAVLLPVSSIDNPVLNKIRSERIRLDSTVYRLSLSIGRYYVSDKTLEVSQMYERALIACISVKGHYELSIAVYTEAMRRRMLCDQRIVSNMHDALKSHLFEVWFQPQYNHVDSSLVEAEALVRWRTHKGNFINLIDFIPVFEKNGFIYEMDKYVWQQVCVYIRKWLDMGVVLVPISINISRFDLYCDDFYDYLTGLIEKHNIPVKMINLEITESAFAESQEQIFAMVKKLKEYGFTIEIDDFGSGYSSFNTLKNIPADVLKLDMRFLSISDTPARGGIILESIVRMAKWLGMGVVAEGVETVEQANYLKSVGCNLIQGYYYARPMPVNEYEALLFSKPLVHTMPAIGCPVISNNSFWNPDSIETLAFNNFIGAGCILEYNSGKTELLRINDKFFRTLGISAEAALHFESFNIENYMGMADLSIWRENLLKTISTGKERNFEVMLTRTSWSKKAVYIKCTLKVVAKAANNYLLFLAVSNVSTERVAHIHAANLLQRFNIILRNVSVGISASIVNSEGTEFVFANDRYYSQLGYTREQFKEEVKDPFEVIFVEDRQSVYDSVVNANDLQRPYECTYRVVRRDGSIAWLASRISLTMFPNIKNPIQLAVTSDITKEKEIHERLRMSEEQYRLALDNSGNVVCRFDVEDRSLNMSPSAAALLALPEKLTGLPNISLRSKRIAAESIADYVGFYERIVNGEKSGDGKFLVKIINEWRWIRASFSTIFSDIGAPMYAIITLIDITESLQRELEHNEIVKKEQLLLEQIKVDGMTGLLNRKATESIIRRKLAVDTGVPCIMMIADLDNLKNINDTLGHPQGDRAIIALGESLRLQFRRTDTIGRIGGDEFMAFIEGIEDRSRIEEIIGVLFQRLSSFKIGENNDIPFHTSVGISFGKTGESTFEQMYNMADKALYMIKRQGKNQFAFYVPKLENNH